MGLTPCLIRFLKKQSEFESFQGKVLTIGKQEIILDKDDYGKLFPHAAVTSSPVTDNLLFSALGFSEVSSLDYYGSGATIEHDLNIPLSDTQWQNSFDTIIDGGTLEHCFDVVSSLATIVSLLKPGGRVIHINPTQGYSNHSFYNFQPTFYYSYYGANGFDDLRCFFLEFESEHDLYAFPGQARVLPVQNYNNLSYSTDKLTLIYFTAKKPLKPRANVIPIQEYYYRLNVAKKERGGARLPDNLYNEIAGLVPGNSCEALLAESYDF